MRQIVKRLGRWSRPRNGQGWCETEGVYALLVRGVLYGPGTQQECTAALSRLPADVMRAEMAESSFLIANRQVLRRRPLVELAALQMPAAACGGSRPAEP